MWCTNSYVKTHSDMSTWSVRPQFAHFVLHLLFSLRLWHETCEICEGLCCWHLFLFVFFTEAAPFHSTLFTVVFIVAAVLLTFALVIVYKYKCHKGQGLFNSTNTCTETCTRASTHICRFCKHLLCCVFPGAGVDTNRHKTKVAEAVSEAEVSTPKFKAMLVDTRDCDVNIAC